MAKLFEEVLSGTVHSPSADILIHFCPGEHLNLLVEYNNTLN